MDETVKNILIATGSGVLILFFGWMAKSIHDLAVEMANVKGKITGLEAKFDLVLDRVLPHQKTQS